MGAVILGPMRGLRPLLNPAHRSGIHAQHRVAAICTAADVLQRGLKQLQPQTIPASELRSQFVTHGFCHVPNYIDERTRMALLSEAAACKDRFQSTESHTIYQEEKDTQAFADEHVRNIEVESSKLIIDYDRAGLDGLRHLYEEDRTLELVQQVVGVDRLYRSTCSYNAAYFNIFNQGDGLGWHFDRSAFGVNLILQMPEEGGMFEFHHNTRSEADPWAFDRVQSLIDGSADGAPVTSTGSNPIAAGSLVIFNGQHSLHRVTPIEGAVPRINIIFTFEREADVPTNPYMLEKFFGRRVS